MSGIFALLFTQTGGGAVVVTSDSSFGGTAISVEPFG